MIQRKEIYLFIHNKSVECIEGRLRDKRICEGNETKRNSHKSLSSNPKAVKISLGHSQYRKSQIKTASNKIIHTLDSRIFVLLVDKNFWNQELYKPHAHNFICCQYQKVSRRNNITQCREIVFTCRLLLIISTQMQGPLAFSFLGFYHFI